MSDPELPDSSPPVVAPPLTPDAHLAPPAERPPPVKRRSIAPWLVAAAAVFASSWCCCGAWLMRSCGSSAAGQAEARNVAQQYLDAVASQNWQRVHDLSDPATTQSLEEARQLFESHPEFFRFDTGSFEGFFYGGAAGAGDTMRLNGHLHGQSTHERTFRMTLHEQADGSWRVGEFHVNMELTDEPAPADAPQAGKLDASDPSVDASTPPAAEAVDASDPPVAEPEADPAGAATAPIMSGPVPLEE